MRQDPNRFAHLIVPLTRFFYAMLAVSLIGVMLGSPGSALFFLVVGALAQVVRAAIQESLWQRETAAPAPARAPHREVVPRKRPQAAKPASRPRVAASR